MADSRVNIFNEATLTGLQTLLTQLTQKPLTALIITSGKPDSFIMGADIEAIGEIQDESQAYEMVTKGRAVFDQVAALPFPTVAMINGFCLGGGLELALACDYRVVCDNRQTKLALPEVKLGLCPGWGGSVRLVRLIGVLAAMNIMLTGRFIYPKQAKQMGLADVVVPKRQLKRAALATACRRPPKQSAVWYLSCLNHRWLRPMVSRMLTKKVAANVNRHHYPAPFVMIENWAKYAVGHSAFDAEAKAISQLMLTQTSRNLLRVFHLREQLNALTKVDAEPISHVHVIGAGTMGADIASVCALNGMTVTLQDTTTEVLAKAIARAQRLFQKKLKVPYLIQAASDRLIPDLNGHGIEKADLIIEAIVEDVAAKQALFKNLLPKISSHTLLATNTSSIALAEIAEVLPDPGQLIGIHFFNPVPMMPLVEVVTGEQTDPMRAERALVFVGQLNKLPLPVKSVPGFLVNRVLMPYLLESVNLLAQGYRAEEIDHSARDFGMPMGPIELSDRIGLDVCLLVARNLTTHYGGQVPEKLEALVKAKRLGCKTQAGFYSYKSGKPVRKSEEVSQKVRDKINECLIGCLVREAERAREDKVVASADLVDAGLIFGAGFAPFRGGPLHDTQSKA